jgi:hypothetical protein
MHRLEARVISVMLLLALAIALSSAALGPEFGPPGHYDGDDDDVGLIWQTLPQAADVPVIASQLTVIPSAPTESLAPGDPIGPRRVGRDPRGSRAPPA